jgi:choline kinase
MNAVVLAAGVGKRLQPFTDVHPKSLLRFGEETLLERHIKLLGGAGIEAITIVIGHLAEQVREEVCRLKWPAPLRLLHNARYREGSALSLLTAADALSGTSSLVMDGDILYGRELLHRLIQAPWPNCLLADPESRDSGEEVKVVVREDGRVCELGKRVHGGGRVVGESVGMFKFEPLAGKGLADRLRSATASDPSIEYEPVIDGLLKEFRVDYVSVKGLPWTEIDFWGDVERARAEVYPRLVRSGYTGVTD